MVHFTPKHPQLIPAGNIFHERFHVKTGSSANPSLEAYNTNQDEFESGDFELGKIGAIGLDVIKAGDSGNVGFSPSVNGLSGEEFKRSVTIGLIKKDDAKAFFEEPHPKHFIVGVHGSTWDEEKKGNIAEAVAGGKVVGESEGTIGPNSELIIYKAKGGKAAVSVDGKIIHEIDVPEEDLVLGVSIAVGKEEAWNVGCTGLFIKLSNLQESEE